METRALGKTGLRLTPIGLGCWQFSAGAGLAGRYWPALAQDEVNEIVKASLSCGVNWFDTAELYGRGASERALSQALAAAGAAPADVHVATKWWPFPRLASSMRRAADAQLERLHPYPISLYQIHQAYSLSSLPAQMGALAEIAKSGRTVTVGVSNYSAARMEASSRMLEAKGLVLAANQVKYSLLDRRIERNGVLETAKRLGVAIIAYSPLAQGLLSGKYHARANRPVPAGYRRYQARFRAASLARTRPLVDLLAGMGAERGASPAQMALAWLIRAHGENVFAIPGASRAGQAQESAGAAAVTLTPAEIRAISEASQAAQG